MSAWTTLLCVLPCALSAAEVNKSDLLGCWQRVDKNPEEMMSFEESRFINVGKDYREITPLIYDVGKVVLLQNNGLKVTLKLELKDGNLLMNNGDHVETYKKLLKTPPELDYSPLKLGDAKDISANKLKSVQDELAKRIVEDQAVRKQAERTKDMASVDAENTKWLRGLILEVGWIDVKRFGRDTATNAFLIVQHSGDLRMMQAALPDIEKDMRAGIGNPQDYALLYDRLKLNLGEKQRYGTQIGSNATGESIILPLEDKTKVEEYRKAIGLFPLSQYLQIFKQQTGKEVKFSN